MNGKILEIKYCPQKGSPFINVDDVNIDKKGIPSDFHYGDEIPISIYLENDGHEHENGFCTGKFHPNIVIRVMPDNENEIGDVVLKVRKKKKCYSDCPVSDKDGCKYNSTCYFAEVVSQGEIKIGDTISMI